MAAIVAAGVDSVSSVYRHFFLIYGCTIYFRLVTMPLCIVIVEHKTEYLSPLKRQYSN